MVESLRQSYFPQFILQYKCINQNQQWRDNYSSTTNTLISRQKLSDVWI